MSDIHKRKRNVEYQYKYWEKNPWAKHKMRAQGRSKTLGRYFNLSTKEAKALWDRDDASKMDRPSIDRIDPKKGYYFENCRFLELSENISRGHKGIPKEFSKNAKLDRASVLEIRRRYKNENITHEALAKEFNVSRTCVCAVVNKKNWKYV